MEMSLASSISSMQHNQIRLEAQYKVMGMIKDKMEEEGAQIIRLLDKQMEIQRQIESHRGQNLNIYA